MSAPPNELINSEPSQMEVVFHADPVNIQDICADLETHGTVFIETTRPNFRNIANAVEANGTKVLPLAAKGPDGDSHNFLLRFEDNNYQVGITEERVLTAILAWRAAGEPTPHVEIA